MHRNKRHWAQTLALAGLLACGAANAETVDFSLSDDAFRFGLAGPLSRLFSGVDGQYELGVLNRERHGNDTWVTHAGALLTGDAGVRGLDVTAGAGLRGVWIGGDGDNGGAVAPGLQVEARLPAHERLGAMAYGYYAPDVVSFGDIDRYHDVGGALSYEIIRNAALYVGYRNVRVGVENGPNVTVDSGFFGGIFLKF